MRSSALKLGLIKLWTMLQLIHLSYLLNKQVYSLLI